MKIDDVKWCLHIPGPDDLIAEPSHDDAVKAARRHNEFFRRRYFAYPPTVNDVSLESMLARVIRWPWSAETHAHEIDRGDARYG